MKSVKKIAIIGVGLMGGSLALALKKRYRSIILSGYARSASSYRKLKRLGVTDCLERDLTRVVASADIIVFALPVYRIIDYFKRIAPVVKKGAIVIDLGSTKKEIAAAAKKILPRGVSFVGCHPLCGGSTSGAEFAKADLYRDSICIITTNPARSQAARKIKKLWESLGCSVFFLDPAGHDSALSGLSHLPHVISFCLSAFTSKKYPAFARGLPSLQGMTRISQSPAVVWADIFLSNKKNLIKDTRRYRKALKSFEALLARGKKRQIIAFIEKVNRRHKILNS